jgi:SulP family sulfate permease
MTSAPFELFPQAWKRHLRGDLAGGLIAAVVSIPMSIGFGLLAFAPFGERFLPLGILAGLNGAMFIGLAALVFGARSVTIYAPRSLIAFMVGSIALHAFAESPARALGESEPLYLVGALLATLSLAGLFQVVFGAARLGGLVRFIPSPVMAGFQNAAALLILYSQLHVMMGLPQQPPLAQLPAAIADVLTSPKLVNVLLGAATVAVIWQGRRISQRVPPALLGLMFGTAAYYALSAFGLAAWLGPTIGTIPDRWPNGQFFGAAIAFATHPAALKMAPLIVLSALSLAVVASLDVLICSRIVEAMTGQRTDANRLLRLIGAANVLTPLMGGISGGASITSSTANYRGGGRTSLSLLVHCGVIFLAVVGLAPLLGRLPLVVVGAVLVVTALHLVDKWSLQLVRKVLARETLGWRTIALDLAVIATVAVSAIAGNLIIAVLIGVGLAVLLFVRRMSRSIVRREQYGDSVRSRRARDAAESELLVRHGRRIVLLQLEGPVFFGSAESLADRIDSVLAGGALYVIVDFRRVNDLDSTGANVLLQAEQRLKAGGGHLLLAWTHAVPHVNMVLRDSGVFAAVTPGRVFGDADRALEWAENRLLEGKRPPQVEDDEYAFAELDLLAGFAPAEREAFRTLLRRREYERGQIVFREGAEGDELYVIVRGSASVKLRIGSPDDEHQDQRLVTFGAGTVFGEMALLDREARSATVEVEADERMSCYVLDRAGYERIARDMHPIAIKLLTNLGRELSARLRRANWSLHQLES